MPFQIIDNCCDRRPSNQALARGGPLSSGVEEPPAKTRILFVDDEPSLLRLLKMGMTSMTGVWEMEFAANGEEALALIGGKMFDVVVTDMRMPGMNGEQLLNHVLRLHPRTIRIILSGYSDLSEAVACVGLTHQFLQKPCSLNSLKDCLNWLSAPASCTISEKSSSLTAGPVNIPPC